MQHEELMNGIENAIGCVYDAAKAADGQGALLELLKQSAQTLGYARDYAKRISDKSNHELECIHAIYDGWSPADLEENRV